MVRPRKKRQIGDVELAGDRVMQFLIVAADAAATAAAPPREVTSEARGGFHFHAPGAPERYPAKRSVGGWR